MHKIITLLTLSFFILQCGFATPPQEPKPGASTSPEEQAQKPAEKPETTATDPEEKPETKPGEKAKENTVSDTDTIVNKKDSKCECTPDPKPVTARSQWFLILSPYYLLVLMVAILILFLSKFKITEALSENQPLKKTIKNPEYNGATLTANARTPNLSMVFPPTIEVSNVIPDLFELQDIYEGKKNAVESAKMALEDAKQSAPDQEKKVAEAKDALEKIKNESASLELKLKTSREELAALKEAATPDETAIADAEKKVEAAEKLVTENLDLQKKASETHESENAELAQIRKHIENLVPTISDAEKDEENAKKNVDTAQAVAKNNPGSAGTVYRPSISRYIAFVTSMLSIILITCLSSFFIYQYMYTGCPPDLSPLTPVLIALAAGVAPYITNKVSTAANN